MAPTIRTQLIDYLDRHPSATADEIRRALDVTKENVQYHLQKLLKEEIIDRTAQPGGPDPPRGRPTYLYRLSEQSRPGNIPALADKLLEIVLANHALESSQPALFTQLAALMFPFQSAAKATQLLRQSIQRLNQHHYQAAWEARSSGPVVYFRSCPYASLIDAHPQLCQLDCAILASLLHRPVTQRTKMDLATRIPPACIFQIHPSLPSLPSA